MNTKSDYSQSSFTQPPTSPLRRELLWQLHGILRGIGVSDGGFRAVTGRWPVQLADAQLKTWISWFTASNESGLPLPPIPLDQSLDGTGPEQLPSAHNGNDHRARNPIADRPVLSRPSPPERRPMPQPYASAPSLPPQPERRVAQPSVQLPDPTPVPEVTAEEPSPELTPEEHTFLEAIRNGANVRDAALRSGISVSTFYQRRTRKPAFDQAWRTALAGRSPSDDAAEEGERR